MNADFEPPALDERKAKAFARKVIEHHFGTKPNRLAAKGGGLTNFVFEASHDKGDFIVRLSPVPAKINDFQKEQWASAKAREAGVPAAEILEVGTEVVPLPYMIAHKVRGSEATHHPERMRILHDMGRLTARIHSIRTNGYGNSFDWSRNQLSRRETWEQYLRTELQVDQRLEKLAKHKVVSGAQVRALQEVFAEVERMEGPSVLHHGDMRLKNVIVDGGGEIISVIDWENCISSLGPFWDLSLALHDLSIDAKEAFVAGYGMNGEELREIAPVLKAFNIVNYWEAVEKAASENDAESLQRYRLRMSGALDLYCVSPDR